jgi:nucleoside-diphosphate-sugar epimerase
MTVLVTGASGLIGRHVVTELHRRGESVRTFQRNPPSQSPDQDPAPWLEHVAGDVRTDCVRLIAAARGCRAIVHLAGRGDVGESRRDPLGYAALNATGALHALEAARAAGATFLLASSQRVYPLQPGRAREQQVLAPDSPYGYAKWVAELWCRMASEQYGVTTRVLRFFSVYGPGQQPNGGSGVVSIFARAALTGQPLLVQSAGQRDFTDARDVARALALAIDLPPDQRHRVFNVATGTGTTFLDLAQRLTRLTRSTSSIDVRTGEPAGADLVADIGRARDELGYQPTIELDTGLEHYLRWLEQELQ